MKNQTKILEDWEVVKLGDVAEVSQGVSLGRLKYKEKGKNRIIKVGDLKDNGFITFLKNDDNLTDEIIDDKFSVNLHDILVLSASHSPKSVGKIISFVKNLPEDKKVFLVAELLNVRAKENEINPYILFYWMLLNKENVHRLSTGQHLYPKNLQKLKVIKPKSLEEQRAIAKILSTVDSAIQKTDKIIEKTERLKRGFMQKLFENKKRKFDLLTNEKYFKLIMGQSPPSNTYNLDKEGLPFYQGNADFGELSPKPRIYCDSPMKIAEKNDILISVRAPVGELNIANQKCCIGRGLGAIRIIEGSYLFYFYFLNYIKKRIQILGQGSTFKAITRIELKRIKVPIPNPKEQTKIASILNTIDKKLELERKRKEKLERIKNGLMNDLLNGRKRVNAEKVLKIGG